MYKAHSISIGKEVSITGADRQPYSAVLYAAFAKFPVLCFNYPENPVPTSTKQETNSKKNRGSRSKVLDMPAPDAPVDAETPPDPILDPPDLADADEDAEAEGEQQPDQPPREPKKRGRPLKGEVRSPATDFFERRNATPNFRETSQYWAYRLEPITDLVATGRDKYIGIFQEPLDEDKLMKHPHCGSGVYMLMFKTRNENGQMVLAEKLDRLDIENIEYPPCIPPGAWLADRRNARWEWAKKIYDEQAKEAERKNAPPSQTMTAADIISVVRETLDARMPSQAPAKDETVLSAVRLGMEQARASAPQDNGSMQLLRDELKDIREQLKEEREQNRKYQQQMLDDLRSKATAAPAKSATEQLEEYARTMETMEKIRPRRGPVVEEHPAWDLAKSVLGPVAEAAAPLLGVAIQRAMSQPPAQPRPAQPPQPGQPQPQPQPKAVPAPEQPQGAAPMQIPKVLADHVMTALIWLQEHMSGTPNRTGTDFADWLDASPTTKQVIPALRRIGSDKVPPVPPVDEIINIAKSVPLIWNQIGPVPKAEEKLREFLTEIITWTPAPPDDEPEEPNA